VIVDSSAIIAILRREPTHGAVLEALARASSSSMSAVTVVEVAVVLERLRDPVLSREADEVLALLDVAVVPFDEAQARIAQGAYRDFGRGSGHPARLNFGDVCSYALATVRREPLLFVGDDFTHTDVQPALRADPPPP
jgi:ribonuclease VapC